MSSVVEGIKDLLVAEGVGVFAAQSGWSINISREPSEPDTAITITGTGGPPGWPTYLLDFPNVQVRVRGAVGGFVAAEAKAIQVKDVLLGLPSQDLNGDRWDAILLLSDVVSAGYDDNDRPLLTVNFSLIIEPAQSADSNRVPLGL